MAVDDDYGLQTKRCLTIWQENSKTVVSLLLLFGTIACISAIVLGHKFNHELQTLTEKDCLDVAVVGAGISGSYVTWRLRHERHNIHLFESTDRIGGRIFTRRFYDDGASSDSVADVTMEMGARFFIPGHHPLLNRTVWALRLATVAAPLENPRNRKYFVRGRHFDGERHLSDSDSPYQLSDEEKRVPVYSLPRLALEKSVYSVEDFELDPLSASTVEGKPLYSIGYESVLSRLTNGASSLIKDTVPWKSSIHAGSAAALASWQLVNEDLDLAVTLSDGMDQLPRKLVEEFLNASVNHAIFFNRHLVSVTRKSDFYDLNFVETVTRDVIKTHSICARKVILALPPPSLRKLDLIDFRHHPPLTDLLNNIHDVPAVVTYFVYNTSWWGDDETPPCMDTVTDLPNRHVRYLGRYTKSGAARHVFMVVSADDVDAGYYERAADDRRRTPIGVYQYVTRISRYVRAACQLGHGGSIPRPEDVLLHEWTTASPSGGGRFVWRIGCRWDVMGERLLRPTSLDDLFLVGDAYASGPKQVWAEGALETVETVLRRYWGISEQDFE